MNNKERVEEFKKKLLDKIDKILSEDNPRLRKLVESSKDDPDKWGLPDYLEASGHLSDMAYTYLIDMVRAKYLPEGYPLYPEPKKPTPVLMELRNPSEYAHLPSYVYINNWEGLINFATTVREQIKTSPFNQGQLDFYEADVDMFFLEDTTNSYTAWLDSDSNDPPVGLVGPLLKVTESSFILEWSAKHDAETKVWTCHYFNGDESKKYIEQAKHVPEHVLTEEA